MWVLYSLLGFLALLIVLLSIPVFGRICYDGDLSVVIRVLGIPITLVPQPEDKSPRPTRKAKTEPSQKPSKFKELVALMKQDDLAGTLHAVDPELDILHRGSHRRSPHCLLRKSAVKASRAEASSARASSVRTPVSLMPLSRASCLSSR